MTAARKIIVAGFVLLATSSVRAQQLPSSYIGRFGGVTTEVCVTPIVTAGTYSAGTVGGGMIALPNAFLTANAGVLQSVRLTSKSAQTAEFDIVFFSALPSTVFTDYAAPAIVAADALLAQPPIKLTNNYSGLGTDTIYGADAIGRPINEVGSSAYAVITTTGTPTFASTSDITLCAAFGDD
jgi:hypothetical protein